MIQEEEEPETIGAADQWHVRHMIGGRSDMLWFDRTGGFTVDHTQAKVLTAVEAMICAAGSRQTYKLEEQYVFDVVAVDSVERLIKAASLSIVKEREDREAVEAAKAAAKKGVSPVTRAIGGSGFTDHGFTDPDHGYDLAVEDGRCSIDHDDFYLDEDGDGERIKDSDYLGGYARKGYHKTAGGAVASTVPRDPNKLVSVIDGAVGEHSSETLTTYEHLVSVFGEPKGRSDKWQTNYVWHIVFGDGETATISDLKKSSTYEDDLPDPEDIQGGQPINWVITGTMQGASRASALL